MVPLIFLNCSLLFFCWIVVTFIATCLQVFGPFTLTVLLAQPTVHHRPSSSILMEMPSSLASERKITFDLILWCILDYF